MSAPVAPFRPASLVPVNEIIRPTVADLGYRALGPKGFPASAIIDGGNGLWSLDVEANALSRMASRAGAYQMAGDRDLYRCMMEEIAAKLEALAPVAGIIRDALAETDPTPPVASARAAA
jgi:hypothetical protein